jgi:hypothetical protein
MAPQSEDVPAKFRLWVVAKTFQHLLYCWLCENINKSLVGKRLIVTYYFYYWWQRTGVRHYSHVTSN